MFKLGTMAVKAIPGYRVQPRMPIGFPYFGATILDAGFVQHPNRTWCVEVKAKIGLNKTPYFLILSIEQARAADIVEAA
jgi:hypothetical protein